VFVQLAVYNEVDRLVGNKVECNGCTWCKACNALTWCPSDQWWAGCRKKDEKQVWTGLLLASVEFLQAFASQKMWNTQVTLVNSVGLYLTVCLSTLPITLLDLLWTAGNGTLVELKQIYSFVCVCICLCIYVCIHKYTQNYLLASCPGCSMYMVRQFNSRNSRSVLLGCWVRQTRVLKHVWSCSNLCLHEPQTKWIIRSWAAEEVVCVCGIRRAEKWVTRIWSSR